MDKDEILRKAENDEELTVEEVVEYEKLFKPVKQTYGKWGTIADKYLEENNYAKFMALIASDNYSEYLHGIDRQADEIYKTMHEKLSKDERYKRTGNYLEDVRSENQIKQLIDEEIYNELIYVD